MYTSLLISFYLVFRRSLALARLERGITAIVRAVALEQLPKSGESRADPDA
jgi:hypothetical protein